MSLRSNPNGLQLPQTLGAFTYDFASWSDGLAQTHNITASSTRTLTASFTQR